MTKYAWCYSSKAGLEDTPFHHFLMDLDRPYVKRNFATQEEYVLPSKTKKHFHVIRPFAKLLFEDAVKEIIRRKGDLNFVLVSDGVDGKRFYLKVYKRIPELHFMERYVKW